MKDMLVGIGIFLAEVPSHQDRVSLLIPAGRLKGEDLPIHGKRFLVLSLHANSFSLTNNDALSSLLA
jgi:hypothetical protein